MWQAEERQTMKPNNRFLHNLRSRVQKAHFNSDRQFRLDAPSAALLSVIDDTPLDPGLLCFIDNHIRPNMLILTDLNSIKDMYGTMCGEIESLPIAMTQKWVCLFHKLVEHGIRLDKECWDALSELEEMAGAADLCDAAVIALLQWKRAVGSVNDLLIAAIDTPMSGFDKDLTTIRRLAMKRARPGQGWTPFP